jgi:hypothetical protein
MLGLFMALQQRVTILIIATISHVGACCRRHRQPECHGTVLAVTSAHSTGWKSGSAESVADAIEPLLCMNHFDAYQAHSVLHMRNSRDL